MMYKKILFIIVILPVALSIVIVFQGFTAQDTNYTDGDMTMEEKSKNAETIESGMYIKPCSHYLMVM